MDDFVFGEQLGEGSYSTVVQAVDASSGRQFAIKVLNKRHIMKEKKTKYVHVVWGAASDKSIPIRSI